MDRDDLCWIEGMLCLIVSFVAPAPWQQVLFGVAAIVLFVVGFLLFVLLRIERHYKRKHQKVERGQ